VHSALSALGWVCGGPVAVVQALLDVLGPEGTLVVPTHTPANSDPANWTNPPVPQEWWPVIRDEMPAFDPAVTPSQEMGIIAETVRTWPGAQRSDHPHVSFAALGPAAEKIVAAHPLAGMLGENSPLGRVYALDGQVLLLGVGYEANTSFHLAEYRLPDPPRQTMGAAVRTADGGQQWVTWTDIAVDSSDFAALGQDFDRTGRVRTGQVAAASCRLMRQRDAVDFALPWLLAHRRPAGSPPHPRFDHEDRSGSLTST